MSISIEAESSPAENLLTRYASRNGAYDELLDSAGRVRETWRQFATGLDSMGVGGLNQRHEQARRLLRENGLLQGIAGFPHGTDRFWELDPLPLLLAKSEWDALAAALTQRVELLNLVLADIYGAQSLLRDGLLPPQLVFGQRSFLLPCHGVLAPRNIYLHMYSGHLIRGNDGRWSVFADYTQGLSGAGLALENRIVTSRILPADFHELHVERLAGFFITLRDTLQSLSPQHSDNPRVVLLSSGPRNPGYFEDAYLARYLGYTLVEGGDLTVRGTNVCLKTLGGLLPVDVVLRRTPDEESDPLELRADSLYGVTGLVEAARSGQVVVANALGSGLLESPALMAFLPAICRSRMGEDLKLRSAATWWCGGDEDWSYVEAHFAEMTLRATVPSRGQAPVDVALLDQRQREQLLQAVRKNRAGYVAQHRADRSTAPVFVNGRLEAWPVGLRVFAVADREGAYQVMPGGLARALPPPHAQAPVGRPGAGHDELPVGSRGKDVWILSDRPVATVTLLRPQAAAVELRRSGNDLPSRVADNLYWLGRHVERADGLVRHLRAVVLRMTSELEPANLPDLKTLVEMLADDARPAEALPSDPEELVPALEEEILANFFHESRSGTLDETLRSLYRTASLVRDRISADTWRIVNQLDLDLLTPRPSEQLRLGETLTILNQIFNLLSSLSGLMTESMTRGPGWRFVDMGRRLERALTVLRLLRKTLVYGAEESVSLLEAVLEIADSAMTYRYRYMTSLQVAPLLDLLLTDETNPRSVGFQLAALAEHVRQLPGKEANPLRNRETRIMIATQAELRLVDVENLARPREDGGPVNPQIASFVRPGESVRWTLDNFLADITLQLWQLSDSLTQTYFTHTGPSRQLGRHFARPIVAGQVPCAVIVFMKYEVTHRTTYRYTEPVTLGHNSTHLTPRTLARQRCLANRLVILPAPSCQRSWTDYFGNQVTYFTVEEEHRELSVTAVSEVAMEASSSPPSATPAWEEARDALRRYREPVDLSAVAFVFDSPCVSRDDRLASYAAVSFPPGRPLLEAALDLTGRIYREFSYDPTATSVSTPTMEVFEKRRGVCQDFAHLEIACLRSLGLAARYVSGYLLTDPRPGQPKLVGADATHAWASIFCPGHGWVDLDPTNDVIPGTRHVTVAWGRDYGDVCPIKGVFLGGGSHWMSVAVDVTPCGGSC